MRDLTVELKQLRLHGMAAAWSELVEPGANAGLEDSRWLIVRVEDWRADIRLRWQFHRFRGGPQSGCHHHVSSPRHIERSVRISRTTLTCLLRAKAYETYPAERTFRRSCVLHHSQPKLWRFPGHPRIVSAVQPSPWRISSVSGPAN
jgi:hypothetical protein